MKVCVIGGGVAGMTTAYRLMQGGHEVALYEASPSSAASSARSRSAASKLEAYYHHIFSTDTTIIDLIDELGVGDRLQVGRVEASAGSKTARSTRSSRRSTC